MDLSSFRNLVLDEVSSSRIHRPLLIDPRDVFYFTQQLLQIPRCPEKDDKVFINLSRTRHKILNAISQELFGWKITPSDKERIAQGLKIKDFSSNTYILWSDDYTEPEVLSNMLPYQKVNHFPGSQQLGRKDLLAQNLNRMRKLFPDVYDFFPQTWTLPEQFEDLRWHIQACKDNPVEKPVFIIKSESSCQGRGIALITRLDNLKSRDPHVVQEYIKRPVLIDDLKFDLQIYALVKSIKPLEVYVYREGFARFASAKYEKPNKENFKNMQMHLTNYVSCIKSPSFQFNHQKTIGQGHKRSLSSIFKLLRDNNEDPDQIFNQICDLILKTIISAQPYLSHVYRSCQPKIENSNMCFEILAFDILLDQNLKPWLLEVNHMLDLSMDSFLDFHIKKNLLVDTLTLLNVSSKDNSKSVKKNQPFRTHRTLSPSKLSKPDFEKEKVKTSPPLGGYVKIFPLDNVKDQNYYESIMRVSYQNWHPFSQSKKVSHIEGIPILPETLPSTNHIYVDTKRISINDLGVFNCTQYTSASKPSNDFHVNDVLPTEISLTHDTLPEVAGVNRQALEQEAKNTAHDLEKHGQDPFKNFQTISGVNLNLNDVSENKTHTTFPHMINNPSQFLKDSRKKAEFSCTQYPSIGVGKNSSQTGYTDFIRQNKYTLTREISLTYVEPPEKGQNIKDYCFGKQNELEKSPKRSSATPRITSRGNTSRHSPLNTETKRMKTLKEIKSKLKDMWTENGKVGSRSHRMKHKTIEVVNRGSFVGEPKDELKQIDLSFPSYGKHNIGGERNKSPFIFSPVMNYQTGFMVAGNKRTAHNSQNEHEHEKEKEKQLKSGFSFDEDKNLNESFMNKTSYENGRRNRNMVPPTRRGNSLIS